MTNSLVSYQPQNLAQLEGFAERLSKSAIVPQQYRGKPNDILAACLWGWETGELTPMIALACIDVIQGRAAYKAEALAGIALKRGLILDIEESFEGQPGTDDYAAVCTVTKPNGKTVTGRFSIGDAKKAGLYGKDNWSKWTERMLRARARGFAVRDASPSAMLGYTSEEVRDFDEMQPHRGPENARDVTPAPDARAAYAIAGEDNMHAGLERHLPENRPGFAQPAHNPATGEVHELDPAPRAPALRLYDASGGFLHEAATGGEWLMAFEEQWNSNRASLTHERNLATLRKVAAKAPDGAIRDAAQGYIVELSEDLAALAGEAA